MRIALKGELAYRSRRIGSERPKAAFNLVPEGYNAELETGTVNRALRLDFPLTVQGRVDKRIQVTLGSGGAPIRAVTTNGGINLRRP